MVHGIAKLTTCYGLSYDRYRVKQRTTWCHKLDHGLSHTMCYMICGDFPPQEDGGDLGSGAVASGDEALLGA